mgnify:CR=1 FL=1
MQKLTVYAPYLGILCLIITHLMFNVFMPKGNFII